MQGDYLIHCRNQAPFIEKVSRSSLVLCAVRCPRHASGSLRSSAVTSYHFSNRLPCSVAECLKLTACTGSLLDEAQNVLRSLSPQGVGRPAFFRDQCCAQLASGYNEGLLCSYACVVWSDSMSVIVYGSAFTVYRNFHYIRFSKATTSRTPNPRPSTSRLSLHPS